VQAVCDKHSLAIALLFENNRFLHFDVITPMNQWRNGVS
jgi:hypothetical protein